MCDRTGNIEYVEGSLKPYTDQNAAFKTIAVFECRGLELHQFFPGNNFNAKSLISDAIFGQESGEAIDLTEGDWAGYDENEEEEVGIFEFKSQMIKS